MAATPPWAAGLDVVTLFEKVKKSHHHPRLEEATIAVCFADTKPFIKGRFNWGKVRRFNPLDKLFQGDKYDFLVVLCATAWQGVLKEDFKKEALVDLHLSRCSVEYVPVTRTEEKHGVEKKIVEKDEWGRIEYTDEIKRDDEGNPKWRVLPLDLHVFAENAARYGVWCDELLTVKEALEEPTIVEHANA